MNYVMPSLGNNTEKISKWEEQENSTTTVFAVLSSFAAMVVGAVCMLCFIGKLLSRWYTMDTNLSPGSVTDTKSSALVSNRRSSSSRNYDRPRRAAGGDALEMQPLGSSLTKGFMLEYAQSSIYNFNMAVYIYIYIYLMLFL